MKSMSNTNFFTDEKMNAASMDQAFKDLLDGSDLISNEDFGNSIDREDTIQDYIDLCGFTRAEAENAYNETINFN
jgi:hypothetical protein